MSRFISFEWENVKVETRPVGWRRIWPLHVLPYLTGHGLYYMFRVEVNGPSPTRQYWTRSYRNGELTTPSPESFSFANTVEEYSECLGLLPYSGEYVVELFFGNAVGGKVEFQREIVIAQAVQDYKPVMIAIGVPLGSALTLIGQWLLSIFTR